jgi:hypothetical protein
MDGRIAHSRDGVGARMRVRERKTGQAPVEFVLGCAVMVVFLLFAVEFGRHFYARFAVRNQVAQAALLAASGRTLVNPESGEEMTRAESVVYMIESGLGSTPVRLESVTVDPADAGGPGDLVQIQARYRFNFLATPIVRPFTPGSLVFTVTSVAKNQSGS